MMGFDAVADEDESFVVWNGLGGLMNARAARV